MTRTPLTPDRDRQILPTIDGIGNRIPGDLATQDRLPKHLTGTHAHGHEFAELLITIRMVVIRATDWPRPPATAWPIHRERGAEPAPAITFGSAPAPPAFL